MVINVSFFNLIMHLPFVYKYLLRSKIYFLNLTLQFILYIRIRIYYREFYCAFYLESNFNYIFFFSKIKSKQCFIVEVIINNTNIDRHL